MDQVMIVLYGESMSYRTPFIPNFGTGKKVCGGRKQTNDTGNWVWKVRSEPGLHECPN